MDRLIKRWDVEIDDDLCICRHRGVAFQRDMSNPISYDAAYLRGYDGYAALPMSEPLNRARVALVAPYADPGATLLDVGAASGVFVRAALGGGFEAKGFDVIPEAVERLRKDGLYGEDPANFDVVTLWDSLEHMEDPGAYLERVRKGALVCVAVPVVEDLSAIRASKHYKPREHFYHFTVQGFIDWMALYGFRLLEQSAHEVEMGRESIAAFAFRRDLPDRRDHIALYMQMHSERFYGSSATELHLANAAKVVRMRQPKSILDYGCGRSDLVAHFWRDGERIVERFDPAIRNVRRLPARTYDLVFCCDVMEHVPMAAVDRVLGEIRSKSPSAFFTISTRLARAKLPDGRNAHVTLLTHAEWQRWVSSYFERVGTLPSDDPNELILIAGPKPARVAA